MYDKNMFHLTYTWVRLNIYEEIRVLTICIKIKLLSGIKYQVSEMSKFATQLYYVYVQ